MVNSNRIPRDNPELREIPMGFLATLHRACQARRARQDRRGRREDARRRRGRRARPPLVPEGAPRQDLLQQRPGVANSELKRRAKVVQAFPSTESVTRLLGGKVNEINADGESGRLFMSKESLKPVLDIRVGLRTPLNPTQSARITPGARSWLPNQVFEPKSLKNAAEGRVAERYCAIR